MKRKKNFGLVLFLLLLFLLLTGCGGMSESSMQAVVEETLVSGETFAMSELLYYSSDNIDDLDPTVQFQFSDGGITTVDALTGAALTSDSGDKAYAEIDEASWKEMFYTDLEPDISGYEKRIEYTVSDSYRVYIMDNEIWIGTFNNGALTALFEVSIV